MEEEQPQQQNTQYQPQQNFQPMAEPKKTKTKSVIYVLLTIALMVAAGLVTYYYINSKQDIDSQTKQEQISKLQNDVSSLNSQLASAKTASSASTASSTTTSPKNELDVLRSFCLGTDPNNEVTTVIYYSGPDGKYADCGVGQKNQPGGARLTAYVKNGQWAKIAVAQDNLPKATCLQYKIPGSIGGCNQSYLQ